MQDNESLGAVKPHLCCQRCCNIELTPVLSHFQGALTGAAGNLTAVLAADIYILQEQGNL